MEEAALCRRYSIHSTPSLTTLLPIVDFKEFSVFRLYPVLPTAVFFAIHLRFSVCVEMWVAPTSAAMAPELSLVQCGNLAGNKTERSERRFIGGGELATMGKCIFVQSMKTYGRVEV
jgi:hypothetical protein